MNKFEKLGLSEELLKSINELGFEKPTPIQENIIPVILEGYDVIGQKRNHKRIFYHQQENLPCKFMKN